jgi:hypothetical protein
MQPLRSRWIWLGMTVGLLSIPLLSVHSVYKLPKPVSQARAIVTEMIHAMDNIITLSGRMRRTERMIDGVVHGEALFKFNRKPKKLYFYNIAPEVGAELLYVEGWNNNKAYVHPNKFPWVNVSLSPHASNFAERQHHSILEAGFEFTNGILKKMIADYGDDFDKHVTYKGKQKWYTQTVDVLEFENPDYGFVPYTVKQGENLIDIEHRLKIPAYKVLEINSGIDDKFDITAGQVIQIPNIYAKKFVVMVDTELHLPIVQLIFDDKGLFEKYEFSELKVNPRFTTMEFSEDNEGYGF